MTRYHARIARTPRLGQAGFAMVEVLTGAVVILMGFLGAYATVIHAGKLVSAAEENAMVCAALEQRMDQLRCLEWAELTDGTGLTTKVWAARPPPIATFPQLSESITISAFNAIPAGTLQGTWIGAGTPSAAVNGGSVPLSSAAAVRVQTTVAWTGRRSSRSQSRTLVTVIAKGGISKSEL